MFHSIPQAMQNRMHELEQIDARDRQDGTPQLERLRQVPAETGEFLALMAACAPAGAYIEIGTSAGYSTMWLSLACTALGRTITTFEVLPEKVKLARETFGLTQLEKTVTLIEGDARKLLADYKDIGFCFLDAEKDVYAECYDLIVPRLVKGGLLVADNVISHKEALQPLVDRAQQDARVDAVVIPMGMGELVCRKV